MGDMRNRSTRQVSFFVAALVSLAFPVTAKQRPSLAVKDFKEDPVVGTHDVGHKSAAMPILKTAADPVPAEHPLLKDGRELWASPAQQPVKTAEQPKAIPAKFADVTST